MRLALAIAAVAALAGCSFATPNHDVTVSVPEIEIDVRPEHRSRNHLSRERVDRGTRYCRYRDGHVTRLHWREECPRWR